MKKRYWKRILSLCMAVMLLALPITGCGKTTVRGETESETIPQAQTPTYLTNIYRGTPIRITDENTSLGDLIEVTADDIVFRANKRIEHGAWGDEDYSVEQITCLYTVPTSGGEGTLEELGNLQGDDDTFYMQDMLLMPDGGVLAQFSQYNEATGVQSYSLRLFRDGTMVAETPELSTFFPENEYGHFYISGFVTDKEGYVYLTADTNLLILTPELTVAGVIRSNEYLNDAIMDGDGMIYFQSWGEDGTVLVPVDREAKAFGTPLTMPEGMADMNGFFFGEGKTLYGYNDTGIYTLRTDGTEGEPQTIVVDFGNSNLAGSVDFIRYVPGGKFLISMYDTLSYERSTAIYEKAPDLDLSTTTVLQVCSTASGDRLLPQLTILYNREHPDKRVVLTQYDNEEMLGQEIRTGTYTPDVILGRLSENTYRSLIEDDYFTDLMPFVEADDTLNRDNLFDCVFNSYSKDGKLYGIPRRIVFRTVIGNKSVVGDRNGWTTHEFVEFLNALPEGTKFRSGIAQENYWDLFGGLSEMLAAFVNWDEKTCSFDSEDFLSLLQYIASLPQTDTDERNYEVSEANPYGEFTEYRNGKTLATMGSFHGGIEGFIRNYGYFGKDNTVYCGYPTADGKNGTLLQSTAQLCTILSFCADTELAWDYIKMYISYQYEDGGDFEDGITALHSQFRELQSDRKTYYHLRYNGGMSWGTSERTPDEDGTYRGEPGDFYTSDDIDFAGIEKWLDEIGSPVLRFAYPEELTNIITEEIGTYLGGARSAEETAKMLQSRVSLYLAEQN